MIRKVGVIFFLSLLSYGLFGQTGPGGVGSSSTNVVWLKADEITGLADNDDVLTWTDASGNSNTFTQPSASFSPIYKTSIINGLPVVRFNKTNGRIRRTSFTGFPTTNITVIYVNSTTDSEDGPISYASSGSNNDFLLFRSNNINVYRGPNIASGVSVNDGAFHIVNASWQSTGGNVEVWKDGSRDFTSSGFQTGTSITAGGSMAIAGEQDAIDGSYDASQAHFGDFTEVMVFNTYLNQAQHIIVSNYLAAKYGLTITNDRYAYQSTHANEVAGIGRESVTDTHTAATSGGVLRIENASGLDADQEYLLFGHDGADITTSWTTTEAPDGGTDIQRLAREWRLDQTGDVGNIDLVVETAGFPSLPAGHTLYALMVDADGDFSSGASVYEMTLSAGTEYTVTGVDIADGDHVAIAAVRPTIQHSLTASSGDEASNASIEVTLNFIPATARSVDATTTDVSATAGDDYTALVASTVTITAGNTTNTYSVTIDNDTDSESNEDFTITLSNPSAGVNLGTNTVHTYSIEDNDNTRKVYFDASSSNGSESVTSVNVGVSLSVVDLVSASSVDYTVSGGTATGSGTDFTLAAGTVNFPASTTTGSFNISINNESLFENDETIIITLSNPVNCNLDNTMPFAGTGFTTFTYTINNDDTAPTIQFNSTSANGSESTTAVAIQVDLSALSGVDASANYTLSGTATGGGTDYSLADGTVSIAAGATTTNINATITNDVIEELSETMVLTLSAPSNATLGTNTVFTYTILNNSVFGFTGPGGVGGSSTNIFWVRPEELADVSDGTDITAWSDNSGNANDLAQANTSFTPRYYGSVLNGFPVARFEQSDNRIVVNNFSDFPTSAITSIYVNSTTDSGDGVVSYASSSHDNDFLMFSSNSLQVFVDNSSNGSGVVFNDNAFHIAQANWQSSDGALAVWKDGREDHTATHQAGGSITAGGTLAIAGEQDAIDGSYAAAQAHAGDMAEVIIYNVALNTTNTIIVHNYLAAKYGLSLASNDIYDQDEVSNGNFDFEVAGIGRVSSSDLHLDAKGSGIVRINDPQGMDDNEFLLWGHDNAELRATNTDVPGGVSRRFERVWRASEVNQTGSAVDLGGVDVTFDLSGLGNVDPNDLVLLVDADGTFATGATQVTGAIDDGSNTYRFNNVTAISDNSYFTLASLDIVDTPLPIELISFSAQEGPNEVTIRWETASETNNSHFTVERSANARDWDEIRLIAGAGNSSTIIQYEITDDNPLYGRSYYRLKQTDFNGTFTYSEVQSVYVEAISIDSEIYPNPLEEGDQLTIQTNRREGEVALRLMNSNGQVLLQKTEFIPSDGKLILAPYQLTQGIYMLNLVINGEERQVFKLMVH